MLTKLLRRDHYMSNDVIFFKPNEITAVIDQIQVSRTAKHLCNYFLKFAQDQIKFKGHEGDWFEFNINEVNTLANIRLKDYRLIEKSLESLMHPVTLRDKDDTLNYLKMCLITTVQVDTKKGFYRFQLNSNMLALLKQTNYFTKLNLLELNPLESKHSLVIYEWLKRYENAPKIPEITIEELRSITGTLTKKAYNNFSNLQKNVIDVAVDEINKCTPYEVSYTTIKTRAKTKPKVTSIQFTFGEKQIEPTAEELKEIQLKQELENKIVEDSATNNVSEQIKELKAQYNIIDVVCYLYDRYKKIMREPLSREKFNLATYTYELSTLDVYARSFEEKKNGYLKNESFFEVWLDDRSSQNNSVKNGYIKRSIQITKELVANIFSTVDTASKARVTYPSGPFDPTQPYERSASSDSIFEASNLPRTVNKKYFELAMENYGKLAYKDYLQYLSDLFEKFKTENKLKQENELTFLIDAETAKEKILLEAMKK